MSGLCINCQRRPASVGEYCLDCDQNLDEMVDSTELAENAEFVNVSRNIFFQTTKVEDGLLGDDPSIIANKMKRDNEDNSVFWGVLLIIAAILVVMMVKFL